MTSPLHMNTVDCLNTLRCHERSLIAVQFLYSIHKTCTITCSLPRCVQVAAVNTTLAPCTAGLTALIVKAVISKIRTGKLPLPHKMQQQLKCSSWVLEC